MEINSLYSVPLFGLASISENTNHDYVVCMYPAHTLQTSLSRYTHYYNAMNDHTEKSDTFHWAEHVCKQMFSSGVFVGRSGLMMQSFLQNIDYIQER